MAGAVWPWEGNPRPSGASSPEPGDSQSEGSCYPFWKGPQLLVEARSHPVKP